MSQTGLSPVDQNRFRFQPVASLGARSIYIPQLSSQKEVVQGVSVIMMDSKSRSKSGEHAVELIVSEADLTKT